MVNREMVAGEGEKSGERVYRIPLFAVHDFCVNLGYFDVFVAEELAHGVKILLLGKEQGGKGVACAVKGHGLGNTGIAEPFLEGNAGAGIAWEAENKVGRPLSVLLRQEERRFPAKGQIEHLAGFDHPLFYLQARVQGTDVSPNQAGDIAPPQPA